MKFKEFMSLKKEYKDQLTSIIYRHLPGCKIYLFGSQATQQQSPGSDIDLALDAGAQIPYKTIIEILIDIDETTIPMKIDLVDMNTKLKKALLDDIKREGIPWTS